MKIVATIEARMNSSRLPNKMMLDLSGQSVISHLISRVKQVNAIDEIVLATTTNPVDDCLIKEAQSNDISYFRGSEENVMQRVLQAAQAYNADILVEVIGDCPLIDPNIISEAIEIFIKNQYDYLSNVDMLGFPIGMGIQVMSVCALARSYQATTHPLDYEHVTRHIRQHPDLFKIGYMPIPEDLNYPDLHLVLDEYDDYIFIKKIVHYFKSKNINYRCVDIINKIHESPELLQINQNVYRRTANE